MELLQLRYFVALAENGHLTHTAEQLMISQPALSSMVARLEDELGVKLFDRVGRSIKLNEFGRIYYEHAKAALVKLESGQAALRRALDNSELCVSCSLFSPLVWQQMINSFLDSYPDICLEQHTYDPGITDAQLNGLDVDFVIARADDYPDFHWDKLPLFSENLYVSMRPDHPLASRTSVRLRELENEQFIFLASSHYFQKYADKLCHDAGFKPHMALECDYALRPKLVMQGRGVALLTSIAVFSEMSQPTAMVRIEDVDVRREVHLFFNPSRRLGKSAELFRDFTVKYCKKNFTD